MNDRQIECFLAVAKTLNFTEAARELYTTQPTISRLINALEEELNVPLFYRTNKAVRMTSSGVILYEHLRAWKESWEAELTRAQNVSSGMDGSLKLGFASEADLDILWDELIPAFCDNHPNIDFTYESTRPTDITKKLEEGLFDLAIELRRGKLDSAKFCSDIIFSSHMALVCGRTHPLAAKKELDPSLLENSTIWTVFSEQKQNDLIRDLYRSLGVTNWKVKYTEDFKTSLVNVRMGKGIMFLDPITKKLDEGHFKIFALPEEYSQIHFSVVWARDNTNPALPMFLEYLTER